MTCMLAYQTKSNYIENPLYFTFLFYISLTKLLANTIQPSLLDTNTFT